MAAGCEAAWTTFLVMLFKAFALHQPMTHAMVLKGNTSRETAHMTTAAPTLSFCGDSSEFTCSPGTMTRHVASSSWDRRVWDDEQFCESCAYKGAKWTVTGFPSAHALYCGFAPWVEESEDSSGMCDANGNYMIGSYVFMAHDGGTFMGINGPGTGYTWVHKSDWESTDASFSEFRIDLESDGSATAYYEGQTYSFSIPSGKGITASTTFRFGCATHGYGGGFTGLEYIAGAGYTSEAETAVGDPHLQNIHGERFDLMRPGISVLVSIPRGTSVENALLVVQADARRLGKDCSDMYFQELNVTGAWADEAQPGGFRFVAPHALNTRPKRMKLGPVELKIVHGHTDTGIQYLNFFVKHLGRAGFPVGGLLGEDDHTEAGKPVEECLSTMALSKGDQKMMPASVAKAYS